MVSLLQLRQAQVNMWQPIIVEAVVRLGHNMRLAPLSECIFFKLLYMLLKTKIIVN